MTRPKKFSPFGNDLFGDQIVPVEKSVLKQKFLFSPFSVLNSREGAWQERKAAWLSIGLKSEVGRDKNLNLPRWICGDSNITVDSAPSADFVWSCPPYADLEVYSDDPADLSNMDYEQFVEIYRSIIFKACARLKDNRFAAFVVGDVRDKHGHYRNFHGETIKAFCDAGLKLYNHAILINAVGTLALRVTRQFQAGRKLGKSHQDLLVFVKGDSKKAANAINNPPPPRPVALSAPPPIPRNLL